MVFNLWSVEFDYVKAVRVIVSWKGNILIILQVGMPKYMA